MRYCSRNRLEEIGEVVVRFERVTKLEILIHLVAVAAAVFGSRDDAGRFEIRQNALNGALCHAHLNGKISDRHHRFPVQTNENVRVIREESPGRGINRGVRGRAFFHFFPVSVE